MATPVDTAAETKAVVEEKDEQTLLLVQSELKQSADGGYPFVLRDTDERHPKGEIYIADNRIHQVAPTPSVVAALSDGKLKKASAKEFSAQQQKDQEAAKKAVE